MPSHFKTKFKRTVRKVFFFLGLLALVAVTLPATGTPGFDGAVNVIGGAEAKPGGDQNIERLIRGASVRILMKNPVTGRTSFACSATLAKANQLVTAAHCFDEQKISGAGAAKYLAEVVDPQTGKITLIPFASVTGACPPALEFAANTCDVAVATLTKSVPEGRAVAVCERIDFTKGRSFIVGSGLSNEDESAQNSPLKFLELEYRETLGNPRTLSAPVSGTQRPCSGDSGGGVLYIEKGRACLRGVHSGSQVNDRPGLSAAESCRQAKNPVTYAVNLAGRAHLVSKLASGETPSDEETGRVVPQANTPRTSAGAR
ncbi:MAG: trypsin-like serine protease [Bdellovibrionaceae bacterium]|nr:trypsin-like serine protease [Pseudobdellovibrionaceae bacterium]